jgi:hypothetical protein
MLHKRFLNGLSLFLEQLYPVIRCYVSPTNTQDNFFDTSKKVKSDVIFFEFPFFFITSDDEYWQIL